MNNEENFSLIDMECTEEQTQIEAPQKMSLKEYLLRRGITEDTKLQAQRDACGEYYQLVLEGKIAAKRNVDFDVDWQGFNYFPPPIMNPLEYVPGEPVGRIEMLDTDGKVLYAKEYTNAQWFKDEIWNYHNGPISVVVYRNKENQTIPLDFINEFDFPVSLRIIDYDELHQPTDYYIYKMREFKMQEEKTFWYPIGPKRRIEVEELLNTAHGTAYDYEDLYEILTARRSLTKRGIDWQTGEPLKKNVPDMDNTPEPVGRIEYLDTSGTVVHGVEYTDAQEFEEDIWSLAGHHGSVIVYRNQKSQTILDHDPPVSLRIMDYDEWKQTADIPSAPLEPIGCIEYLDYNDDVVGSVEFTNAEKFEANINDPDWEGYAQRIVSYRNPEKQATKRQSFKESFAKLFARIEKERISKQAAAPTRTIMPQRER